MRFPLRNIYSNLVLEYLYYVTCLPRASCSKRWHSHCFTGMPLVVQAWFFALFFSCCAGKDCSGLTSRGKVVRLQVTVGWKSQAKGYTIPFWLSIFIQQALQSFVCLFASSSLLTLSRQILQKIQLSNFDSKSWVNSFWKNQRIFLANLGVLNIVNHLFLLYFNKK